MALTKTTVKGRLPLPNDMVLPYGNVQFALRRLDVDKTSNDVLMPVPVSAGIAEDGTFTIDLWPNERGERATVYEVSAHLTATTTRTGPVISMGAVVVPEVGPVDISDLLQIPVTAPTAPDVLAQVLAAAAVTEGVQAAAVQVKEDRIAAEAAAAASLDTVITDYKRATVATLPTAAQGATNGQTAFVTGTGNFYHFDNTKTPAWVNDGPGALAPLKTTSSPVLDANADATGKQYERTDLAGQKYLVGLGGISVQEWIHRLRSQLAVIPVKLQRLATPSILRISNSEGAVMGLQDQVGGLYLPGLGGMAVQDHITRLNQRMTALAKGVGGGGTIGRVYVVDAVADLGCDPTGVEPIQAKVNAGIAKLNARTALNGNLATIYFPEGVYNVTERIFPGSRISFVGAGTGRTRIMPSHIWGAFEKKQSRGTYLEYCIFANMTVDGQNQIKSSSGEYSVATKGMFFEGFRNCLFTDLEFLDTGATSLGIDFADKSLIQRVKVERGGRLAVPGNPGASGIGIGTGWLSSEPLIIADCITIGCKNYGVFVERQSNDTTQFDAMHNIVHGLVARENNYGFGEEGCSGTVLSAAQLTHNLAGGLVQHHGTFGNGPHPGQRLIARGCDISFNAGHGWAFDGSKNHGPRGFSSDGNRIEGNSGCGYHVKGGGLAVDDFRIGADEVIGNGSHGLWAEQGTLTNFDVVGTRFLRNTGAGIRLDANITGGRIAGATIRDMQATPTQTQSIVGGGALTDFDIGEVQGVNCTPINLTGTQTRVTFGRNPGV